MKQIQPPFIQKYESTDTELYNIASSMFNLVMKEGTLDKKTKMLILLALDIQTGSTGVKPIADLARKSGASEEELSEAVRIAYSVAGNKILNSALAAF